MTALAVGDEWTDEAGVAAYPEKGLIWEFSI